MNVRNVTLLRNAQVNLSSAMNTLESLDGEDVDVEGILGEHAETVRGVVESLADHFEEIESGGDEDDDEDDE